MKILIINGSPRGRYSVTLQSCLYLEKNFPEHEFEFLNVGSGIHIFERDMSGAVEAIVSAELLVFAYPVYCSLVPSQLHRFIELLKAANADLRGICATQLSTSAHFFDITAHRFIEDNCRDMGMRVIRGLSAGTEDMLSEQGRAELEAFLRYAVFCAAMPDAEAPVPYTPPPPVPYVRRYEPVKKRDGFDTVIVGDLREDDESLRAMIKDFDAVYPYRTRFVNIADFSFRGGCLGCMSCTAGGRCVHDDGFDRFLQDNIFNADAIVYAFTLRDHSMGSLFKLFDDRQFFCGCRAPVRGKPVAYIVNGDISAEENLRTVLGARSQTGRNFLAGYACSAAGISAVSASLAYALENACLPPKNFYAAAGMKLLRDLVWSRRGILYADHDYFRSNGLYDFPQRHLPRSVLMGLLALLMRSPRLRPRLAARINRSRLSPYKKLLK
ncbi:MAG: NAD(P)H-dependent oxidoreductase [Clostridiales bacterium]|nr:NAD(P)H-dependent oxidoreductase [Clostridiales bacterium]